MFGHGRGLRPTRCFEHGLRRPNGYVGPGYAPVVGWKVSSRSRTFWAPKTMPRAQNPTEVVNGYLTESAQNMPFWIEPLRRHAGVLPNSTRGVRPPEIHGLCRAPHTGYKQAITSSFQPGSGVEMEDFGLCRGDRRCEKVLCRACQVGFHGNWVVLMVHSCVLASDLFAALGEQADRLPDLGEASAPDAPGRRQ
ncbi:hypothetical protein BDZ89DRAFT_1034692 [Hymenopellis radicata]|nr:hypothetical protein BDZ89DRAFT_1034692 [Hymenopellis radicata]